MNIKPSRKRVSKGTERKEETEEWLKSQNKRLLMGGSCMLDYKKRMKMTGPKLKRDKVNE